MTGFFDQFIYGTQVIDYSVGEIRIDQEGNTVKSDFYVLRSGDGVFPVTVRVFLEDGTHEDLMWDGVAKEKMFSLVRTSAVEEIYVDPLDHVWLDINRLNNRKRVTDESSFSYHQPGNVIIWLQHFIQLTSNLF